MSEWALMYDLFGWGLVYPLAEFEILSPSISQDDRRLERVQGISSHVLVALKTVYAKRYFEPDYVAYRDPFYKRHLALMVRPRNEVLRKKLWEKRVPSGFGEDPRCYVRPADGSINTIVGLDTVTSWPCESHSIATRMEKRAGSPSLQGVVPEEARWFERLDWRSRQLYVEALSLEKRDLDPTAPRFTRGVPRRHLQELKLRRVNPD